MIAMPAHGTKLHLIFLANIRARRDELGLTQKDVAERLGTTQPNYGQYEAGLRTPGFKQLEEFAKALECDPLDFLIEKKPRKSKREKAAK